MKTHCKVCNKPFITYPSKIKLGRGKYCSVKCGRSVTNKILEENGKKTRFKRGDKPWSYKGYCHVTARDGGRAYKLIWSPDHPFKTKRGYVREHRLVMEERLGRYLMPTEIVHHLDGDTLNNDILNLELMDKVEHDRMNTPLNIHRRWQKPVGSRLV